MPYTFPTIKKASSCPSEPIDTTLSVKSEGGYVQTRPRNTRQRRKFGPIQHVLTTTDWLALQTFDSQVTGAAIFSWTHPVEGTTFQVRFTQRPKETPVKAGGSYLHSVEYTLEEA